MSLHANATISVSHLKMVIVVIMSKTFFMDYDQLFNWILNILRRSHWQNIEQTNGPWSFSPLVRWTGTAVLSFRHTVKRNRFASFMKVWNSTMQTTLELCLAPIYLRDFLNVTIFTCFEILDKTHLKFSLIATCLLLYPLLYLVTRTLVRFLSNSWFIF